MEFEVVKTLRGLSGRISGGHRVFFVDPAGNFDDVAWGGLALAIADGIVPVEQGRMWFAELLLYSVREHLQEYRRGLAGWRELYRTDEPDAFATSLLGSWTQASARFAAPPRGTGRGRGFRDMLGRQLAAIQGGGVNAGKMPAAITGAFRLAPRSPELDRARLGIRARLAQKLEEWGGGKRGRCPTDWKKWMRDHLSRPGRPPFCASREELAYSVAFCTWNAHAIWYPYGMAYLMEELDPPLDKGEEALFSYFHTSTDLIGVPIATLPGDLRDLIRHVEGDMVGRRISVTEARARAAKILNLHGLLVDDARDQDRQRKQRKTAEQKRQAIAASQRGRRGFGR